MRFKIIIELARPLLGWKGWDLVPSGDNLVNSATVLG